MILGFLETGAGFRLFLRTIINDGNVMVFLKLFGDGGKNEKREVNNFSPDAKLFPIMLANIS